MTALLRISLILCAIAAVPADALALRARDVTFAEEAEVREKRMTYRNRGTLKYKRLISVYEAALYIEEGAPTTNALADVARRVEVVYLVNARAKRFCDAGARTLQKAWSDQELSAVQERLDRINALYPDARKGDRCAITYSPGFGTELTYNEKSLGVIKGDDFARIYFSIWLGDKPADKNLRNALLSTEKE